MHGLHIPPIQELNALLQEEPYATIVHRFSCVMLLSIGALVAVTVHPLECFALISVFFPAKWKIKKHETFASCK
jgi:hypothetical protein